MHITISRLDARVAKLHRTAIAKQQHHRDTKRWTDREHPSLNPPKLRPSMEAKAFRRSRARLLAL